MAYEAVSFAVRHKLINTAAVTNLVGQKIYPFAAPQLPALPFVLYQSLDPQVFDDIQYRAGLFYTPVQLDCYAMTPEAAWEISEELRKALQGYSGVHLNVTIRGIRFESRADGFEKEVENFRVMTRFGVWHIETVVPSS